MHVSVVTPPSAPLTDAATVRSALQISATTSDATINGYIKAVTDEWDGPGGDLGRALGAQTLELQAAHFPGNCLPDHTHYEADWHHLRHRKQILLPFPEIISVDSVEYLDLRGDLQTLDPSAYVVVGRKIGLAHRWRWPITRLELGAVTITYTAGFAADAIPGNLISAIILRVQQMQTMTRPDMLLKQKTVFGVGMRQYETQADVQAPYDRTIERLIAGLRVYA